ncbi:response regulator transcription factor [Amphibacillus jilinensis]|uniref:response regulator transcription factor n=1 Tax=Amphibacillus jilinensis TaxID=1216008 RepID=UPI000301028A|nr:response regulator transcription factor [Amphibacillus jilinensis]
MVKQYSVLIAEKHKLYSEIIAAAFKGMGSFNSIKIVRDSNEVIKFVESAESMPNLCLVDVQIQDIDGICCTEWLKKYNSEMKVVLLSDHKSKSLFEKSLLAGIDGYLLKESSLEKFKQEIKLVLDGQFVAPKYLINDLSEKFMYLTNLEKQGHIYSVKKCLESKKHLNFKENDYQLILSINKGWSNKKISEELNVSEGNVKNAISRIYRKLNINSRTQLMQMFFRITD